MSSRWQYSTSCWFLLPVLSPVIYLGVGTFTFHHLSEVLPGAICPCLWGSLVLLVSLASLPGAPGLEALLPSLGSPVFRKTLLLWQEGEGMEEPGSGASAMSGTVGFVGAAAVDKSGGVRYTPKTGDRSRAPLPLLLGSLWSQGSLWQRLWNCMYCPLMLCVLWGRIRLSHHS